MCCACAAHGRWRGAQPARRTGRRTGASRAGATLCGCDGSGRQRRRGARPGRSARLRRLNTIIAPHRLSAPSQLAAHPCFRAAQPHHRSIPSMHVHWLSHLSAQMAGYPVPFAALLQHGLLGAAQRVFRDRAAGVEVAARRRLDRVRPRYSTATRWLMCSTTLRSCAMKI